MLDMLKGKVTRQDWIYVGSILAVTVVLAGALYYFVIQAENAKITARAQQLAGVDHGVGKRAQDRTEHRLAARRKSADGPVV